MRRTAIKSSVPALALLIMTSLDMHAGTVKFKDGTTISEAEIVSISGDKMVIEKDKKRRSFSLNQIDSYFSTDISATDGSIPGNFAGYKITIDDIKMPDRGKDKDNKEEKCTIGYMITKEAGTDSDKIKVPYFYLYVFASADEDGDRKIYTYYHPDDAKPKGKGYDEAAILKEVNSFGRKIIDYSEMKSHVSIKNFGQREFTVELGKIGRRRIIAYHLDVWGNDKIVLQKNWKHMDHKVGDEWWKKE